MPTINNYQTRDDINAEAKDIFFVSLFIVLLIASIGFFVTEFGSWRQIRFDAEKRADIPSASINTEQLNLGVTTPSENY